MDFELTDRCQELRERLLAFMDEHVYPAEPVYHEQLVASGDPHFHPPVMEELKARARDQGLWNLLLPHEPTVSAPGLTNLEYAPLAEIMGRSHIAPGGVQLRRARHGQHGGSDAVRDRPSRRSAGWRRCSRARSAPRSR